MKTFKSITDVEQLRNHPLHATVESLVVPVIAAHTDIHDHQKDAAILLKNIALISEQSFVRRKFRTNILG